MASLTKKLYYAKSGTNKTIKLYSAKSDCLDTTTGPFVHVNLDGTTGYAGLISGNGKGSYPSDMRVEFNGSTYTVQNTGYHRITITQPSNGQIKITHNGNTYTTSFDAMMEGVYIVTATPNSGYKLTSLKVDSTSISSGSSQTCTKAVSVTATIVVAILTLSYYGTATALSQVKSCHAATTVGNYALFAGGINNEFNESTNQYGWFLSTVDAYNSSLTRSTPASLSIGLGDLTATTVGNYALFAGGNIDFEDTPTPVVNAYNSSLTRSIPTQLSVARNGCGATTVGNYALFAGGNYMYEDDWDYDEDADEDYTHIVSTNYNTVDAYNSSLTRSIPTVLSVARFDLAATTVGDYALFAGGRYVNTGWNPGANQQTVVDAYNSSLIRSIPTSLSIATSYQAATTVGDHALFASGYNGNYIAVVNAYNSSLTRSIPTQLSVARNGCGATTVGNYALFAGGGWTNASNSTLKFPVDAYNQALTRTTYDIQSPVVRSQVAATTVGNYALFSGGSWHTTVNTVTVFKVS